MVTGIEAAGLALAIFPLVVKGYQEGAGMFADARKHRRVLQRLLRRLNMECIKFENTCTDLLDGLVPPNELARFLKGEGWEDDWFQERLREKFRAEEVDIFTVSVKALIESIQEVGQGLGLDANYKLSRSKWHNVWAALEKEEFNSSLDEIRQINSDLARLAKQSADRPPPEQQNRLFAARNYNKIRMRANSLHSVLHGTFKAAPCSCNHNASLLLEHCPTDDDFRFKVLFNLPPWSVDNMASQKCWHGMEFQSIDCPRNVSSANTDGPADRELCREEQETCTSRISRPQGLLRRLGGSLKIGAQRVDRSPIPKVVTILESPEVRARSANSEGSSVQAITDEHQHIRDLCGEIRKATSLVSSCIGFLIDELGGLQHQAWPPKTCLPFYVGEPVSLEQLLFQKYLEEYQRLELAVKVASAVMQLHRTEWLGESWGTKDIVFLRKPARLLDAENQQVSAFKPALEMPMVRRLFGSTEPPPPGEETVPTTTVVEHEKSLLCLGFFLTELWCDKPLNDFRTDPNIARSDDTDYEVIKQRIGYLMFHPGEDYGCAVSYCIDGLARWRNKSKSTKVTLDNEEFKNEVHINVVSRLERSLEEFKKLNGLDENSYSRL